jgi:Na+/H+ antiporter NhaD/arsenite permease-like protein
MRHNAGGGCLEALRGMTTAMRPSRYSLGVLFAICAPDAACAAALDGTALRWPWALPFIGLLLTIAVGPLLFPRIWHHHYGKLAFVWATLTVVPMAALYDIATAWAVFVHAMLGEYLSFIVLVFTLYVVAGGILVTGNLRGTPLVNTAILVFGTAIASVVGTTGAAMILIRPLLNANAARLHNAHVVVFFILLVANIGGALSPLGDPPLFAGFLRGVDFFWTAQHLWQETVLVAAAVLLVFIVIDVWFYRRDRLITTVGETVPPINLKVSGLINLVLLAAVILIILGSAAWKPGIAFDVYGTTLELQNVLRDSALVLIALLSLPLTPNEHREANGFTWGPIAEVAILFAGIFVTIIPAMAMLRVGEEGAMAFIVGGVREPAHFFWASGILSSFLDNAPTYLAFFSTAIGRFFPGVPEPEAIGRLIAEQPAFLVAISNGSVFMGANTYIGNAPNFMVKSIAEEAGVPMPSFFGYILRYSLPFLVTVFLVMTWLFYG